MKVYSCLNAILCEEVVREVSGQPLDVFAAEHVFKPLGMKGNGVHSRRELFRSLCAEYSRDLGRERGWLPPGSGSRSVGSHARGRVGQRGAVSTVADLSRFAQMMLNGGELDGVRILKAATIRDMTRVQNPGAVDKGGNPDRRGLLWDLYVPDPGDKGVDALFAYGHTGYTGTAIRIYPEQASISSP